MYKYPRKPFLSIKFPVLVTSVFSHNLWKRRENASHVIYIMKQNVQAKLGHSKLTGLKLKHSVRKLRQIPWIIQKNVTSVSSKTANDG